MLRSPAATRAHEVQTRRHPPQHTPADPVVVLGVGAGGEWPDGLRRVCHDGDPTREPPARPSPRPGPSVYRRAVTPTGRNAAFDDQLDDWLAHEFEVSPVTATALGADGAHGAIDDLSAAAFARRVVRRRDLARPDPRRRRRITRTRPEDRPGRGHRRAPRTAGPRVVARLATGPVGVPRPVLRRDPQPRHPPLLPRGGARPATRRAGCARWPGALEAGRANLSAELASPLIVGRAIGQCEAAIPYFQEMLPAEFAHPRPAPRSPPPKRPGRGRVVPGLPRLPHRTGHLGTGRLRHRRGAVLGAAARAGAPRLRRRRCCARGAGSALGELESEMNALARGIDPHAAHVAPRLRRDERGPPRDLRGDARPLRERGRQGPCVPPATTASSASRRGEECRVEPTPPFLRPIIAVASYISPPAFRPGRVGHFNVPWPPAGTTPADNARLLAANNVPRHPHDHRPRGLPRPPLAPHLDEGVAPAGSASSSTPRTSRRAGPSTPSR